jgi:putative superfamily III holin-X
MQPMKQERSLGELFSELAGETSTLVRQEVALAKAELTQKAAYVGRNVGLLVVGGAVVYAAFLAVMAAAVIGLSNAMPWWAAALVVGVVVGIVGGALLFKAAYALKETDVTPRQTVETLKEDAQWVKEKMQ